MNSKVYDQLKDTVQIYMPGSAVLYAALADTWGLGYKLQVVATVAAFSAFLGLFLKTSSANHKVRRAKVNADSRISPDVPLDNRNQDDPADNANMDGGPKKP